MRFNLLCIESLNYNSKHSLIKGTYYVGNPTVSNPSIKTWKEHISRYPHIWIEELQAHFPTKIFREVTEFRNDRLVALGI